MMDEAQKRIEMVRRLLAIVNNPMLNAPASHHEAERNAARWEVIGLAEALAADLEAARAEIERLKSCLGMRVTSNLLDKLVRAQDAVWENFWGMLCISTNREDAARAELREISAAWEAEHSQGGTEPEPALTCMLQALRQLREQKTGMNDGFNTLIAQRDTERARAEKAERERGEWKARDEIVTHHEHQLVAERDALNATVANLGREVEELRRRKQWQPIATAPRDGRFILAYWDEETNPQEFVTRYGLVYWNGQGWDDEEGNDPISPTHWRPLPDPSKVTP